MFYLPSVHLRTLLSGTCRTLATTSSGTPRPHIITAAALQISSTLLASFRASPPLSNSALLTASVRSALASPCRATPMLFDDCPGYASPFRRYAMPLLLFRVSRCRCATGRCHSAALHVTAGPCSSLAHRFHAMPRSSKARLFHAWLAYLFLRRASPRLVSAVPRLSFSKRFLS